MNPLVVIMCRPRILRNAFKVSLVVGTLLNLINHGERLLAGNGLLWGYAFMNYLVPFCVATCSGARALQGQSCPVAHPSQGEHSAITKPAVWASGITMAKDSLAPRGSVAGAGPDARRRSGFLWRSSLGGRTQGIQHAELTLHHQAVLHIFRKQLIAARFQRCGHDQAIPETQAVFTPQIMSTTV